MLLGRLVAGQIGRQDLDRHLTVEARVLGGVDDPHPAVAECGAEGVRAEGGTGRESHGNEAIIACVSTPGLGGGWRCILARWSFRLRQITRRR